MQRVDGLLVIVLDNAFEGKIEQPVKLELLMVMILNQDKSK